MTSGEQLYAITKHFLSFRTAFILTDHSAIWYIFRLHLRRLIGVGQTNDSLSRLVGVSSMYSKRKAVFHILIHSPLFFHFRSNDIGNSIIYFIGYKSLAITHISKFVGGVWFSYRFYLLVLCFCVVLYC